MNPKICDETPAAERDDTASLFDDCVAARGDQPALVYFDRVFTYSEVDGAAGRLAAWLAGHRVGRGERVAIITQNMPQFVMMLLAAWKIGAIPVPGNPMYRRGELARIFGDCRPAAVLCLDTVHGEVRAALESVGLDVPVMITSSRAFHGRDDARMFPTPTVPIMDADWLEDVIGATSVVQRQAITLDRDDIGLLLYTSGTTGEPKGAMIRHGSLAGNGRILRDHCGLHAGSRVLAVAPFFHITGMTCHIVTAFAAGAALVLPYRVEPAMLLEIIRQHRPTFTIGAITVFNALMNLPEIGEEDFASFDCIFSGGAPIPPSVIAAFRERFGKPIHSCYGMTETAAHTHLAPIGVPIPVDPGSGALSIGMVTPGTSARIVADNGELAAPGIEGELQLRGPQIMAGYWGKPEASAVALAGGWMHTGDVATCDGDGWYYLVDRIKDVIIASGFKVWPREVEDVLYTHSAVREAAVIGVADSYRGETVKACVSLKPGCEIDAQELIEYCRERLAAYKVPRLVAILDDLPKTVTGKIQRMALREAAA